MQSEQQYLENYDPSQFDHPSVTVDILIFTVSDRKLQLLLIKRNEHPYMGKWAIPGGFLQMNESADEAASRRIREEAGIENVHLEQLYTFSAVDRDPTFPRESCISWQDPELTKPLCFALTGFREPASENSRKALIPGY